MHNTGTPKVVSADETINTKPKDRRRAAAVFVMWIISVALLLAGVGVGIHTAWQYWHTTHQTTIPGDANLSATHTATAEPASLSISSLGIHAPFIKLGLLPDHTLEVPHADNQVGWFVASAKPGDIGPVIVVGHLDSSRGAAVFANLYKIKPGDTVSITRADGSIATYRVDSSLTYSQNNFPTKAVYGAINYSGLRLITCAGTYITNAKHYSDNLVVFATLISS